jgi:hypothetical protein
MDVQITCVLDAESSARLMALVGQKRSRLGWTRQKLARRANESSGQRTALTHVVLNSWSYRLAMGKPIRIELDKAVALLAAVGVGSNRVDELLAELSAEVASLLEDADPAPEHDAATCPDCRGEDTAEDDVQADDIDAAVSS